MKENTRQKNDRLIQERKVRKLTQHEFAKLLDISTALLSRLETGDLEGPSFENAKRISKILNVPLDVLFPKYKI